MRHFTTRQFTAMIILALVIIGFGFYWYQARPVLVSRKCSNQASFDAQKLLVSKVDLTTDTETKASYKSLADKGMYLRTDYNSFLLKCMLHYGFQIVPVSDSEPAPEGSAPEPRAAASSKARTK
ncbi:MAG: hypothetical protein PHZ00_00705 [Candidatus Peribacteraceae bacterium]|nr:hypothetical protein [Candidatus Peribacteraceae bacterium]